MPQYPPFVMFGRSHAIVLVLIVVVPLLLAALVRATRNQTLVRLICWIFALAISGIWAAWYVVFYRNGWLTVGNALPMDLCSWACIAAVIALIRPGQKSYELAYFWALGGTLQGLLTPDIPFDFPEFRFIEFSVFHGGIIGAVLFMTFGMGMRPYPRSLPRVIVWTVFYALMAGAVDWALGANYGFMRAKPTHASLFDFMPDWPYYIPVLVVLGLLSTLIYYLPFFLYDRLRRMKNA